MKKKLFIIGGILVSLLYISDVKAWTFYNNSSKYNAYGNEQIAGAAANCDGEKITPNNQCGFPNSSTQFVTTAFSSKEAAKNFCEVTNVNIPGQVRPDEINNSVGDWINKGYRCQINERRNDPYYYAYKYPLFINGHHTLREVTKEGNNVIMYVYRIYPIIINYASDPVNPDSYGWYRPPYPGGVYSKDIELTSEYNDDYYAFAYTFDGNANTSDQYDSYDYKTVYGDYKPKKIEYIDSSLLNGEQYNINSGDYKLSDVTVIEAGKNIVESNKRIKSGKALFYNDTAGPQAFLKKYTLNTSKDNYGSDGKKVTIKKGYIMKTINGRAYGEVIKALEDNGVSDQRDYAYYHVYLTKYTFVPSNGTIIPPEDCKITNINNDNSNNVEACYSTKTTSLKSYCKYDNTGKTIKNYKKVYPIQSNKKNSSAAKNIRNDLCYITTDDVSGKYEEISYKLDLQKQGDYLNPELIIEHRVNYTIYYTGNNSDERRICYNNGMGLGRSFYKINNFTSLNIVNGLKAVISYTVNNKLVEKEVNLIKVENPATVDQSCDPNTETSGNCRVSKTITYKYKLNNSVCSGSTRNFNTFENGTCACPIEGYTGKIVKEASGKITIKINNSSGEVINGCSDTFTTTAMTDYIYRPISLENPFPGMIGSGRKIGGNWSETGDGNPVEDVIKKEMDKQNPMYVINLTPDAIREIRTRYSNNYSEDAGRVDDETKACEALNDGKYISGMIENLSEIPSASADGSPSIIEGRCITNNQTENRKCVENFSG